MIVTMSGAETACEKSIMTMNVEADQILDAGQAGCGELLVLIYEAMKTLPPGQILDVIGYDTGAREDIPAWCRMTQNPLIGAELSENRLKPDHYYIQKETHYG